jgi:hypothetical protein
MLVEDHINNVQVLIATPIKEKDDDERLGNSKHGCVLLVDLFSIFFAIIHGKFC